MKRAAELFRFDRRSSRSPLIEQTWQTQSGSDEQFISVAVSHWGIVVTRQEGTVWLTLRGPETKASAAPIPQHAEFFGIVFSHGTFMPGLPPGGLVDRSLRLPLATSRSFWLHGSRWEIPGPNNADVFADRLVRSELVVHDPVAAAALVGDTLGLSTRSVERRVARATGLTRGTIRQIRRAEKGVEMLSRGMAALDVARLAGYADQAHMTRSMRRFVGQTPSEIATTAAGP
jgi:AraC-like DNA-binding protein